MKRSVAWICWLAVLVAFSACTLPVTSDPPTSDSTLVQVLADLHTLRARDEIRGDVTPEQYEAVLRQHGLDSTQFNATLDYYVEHPEDYLTLYDEVLDRLNQIWMAERPTPHPLPDSLRTLIQ